MNGSIIPQNDTAIVACRDINTTQDYGTNQQLTDSYWVDAV